jgi:16S rRNA processing protein RimM
MAVYATDGRYLGELRDVIQTGSNDVYVVRQGAQETLVPALVSVVKAIDTQQNRMEVDLPPGL